MRGSGGAGVTRCLGLHVPGPRRPPGFDSALRYRAKRVVFLEGDSADELFEVAAGMVKVYKLLPDGRRQITGFLCGGSLLGLSLNDRYVYTAETITSTLLYRYSRLRLEELMGELPHLAHRLLAMASDELSATQDQMLLLGRKTAIEKLATFLLSMDERFGTRRGSRRAVDLPMTRVDIADYLGLSAETVCRTLNQLRRERAIFLPAAGRVVLLDPERLRQLRDTEHTGLSP